MGSALTRPDTCSCPPPGGTARARTATGVGAGHLAPVTRASMSDTRSRAGGATASSRHSAAPPVTMNSPISKARAGEERAARPPEAGPVDLDADSPTGATRLYESVGMVPESVTAVYER